MVVTSASTRSMAWSLSVRIPAAAAASRSSASEARATIRSFNESVTGRTS